MTRITARFRAALDAAEPQHKGPAEALIAETRIYTRLSGKRRKLRKDLKEVERQMKVTRKNMKRLTAELSSPEGAQTPPLVKTFGEA